MVIDVSVNKNENNSHSKYIWVRALELKQLGRGSARFDIMKLIIILIELLGMLSLLTAVSLSLQSLALSRRRQWIGPQGPSAPVYRAVLRFAGWAGLLGALMFSVNTSGAEIGIATWLAACCAAGLVAAFIFPLYPKTIGAFSLLVLILSLMVQS